MTVFIYGELFKYKICEDNIKALFDTWVKDDIYVALLNKGYRFNYKDVSFDQLRPFEIKADCYKAGGQLLTNKVVKGSFVDADDVKWGVDTFKVEGAALYKKEHLIAYIWFEHEASVIDGTLTIQWSEKGIIESTLFHGQREAYGRFPIIGESNDV